MGRSPILCRCCGGAVTHSDGHPIHTACISRHWGRHKLGLSASRCREFGAKFLAARAATEGLTVARLESDDMPKLAELINCMRCGGRGYRVKWANGRGRTTNCRRCNGSGREFATDWSGLEGVKADR